MADLSERIARLRSSIVRDILAAAQDPGVISFAGGLPALESIPTLRGLDLPPELGQYGATEGEPRLRQLVSEQLAGLGLRCPPEQILILSGSQQGIDLVSKLFIDDGSRVLTENPTYLAALQVFRLFGAHVAPWSTGPHAPARFAYFVPTFQNPTGATYSTAERRAIAATLGDAALPLFEDDPYRELSFVGPAPEPIAALLQRSHPRASWVYQGSFSKVFMPGLRLGYLAASEDLIAPLVRLKQAADLHANRLSQWLVIRELEDPTRAARLEALRDRYRRKRDLFQRSLQAQLGQLARWSLPRGGLFFWLELQRPLALSELLPRALEQGVAFVPGDAFFCDSQPAHSYLRLNFSQPTAAEVPLGLERLAAVLRSATR